MAKKKHHIEIPFTTYDVIKRVRSPFATVKMTGAGAHKSKKDFNRQAQKLEDRKLFKEYK